MPEPSNMHPEPPLIEVIIEIPRGSFLKRGSRGQLDFVSPIPCPFNYGSIQAYIGLDGDYLDAVVLGPRLHPGTQTKVYAWGAVQMVDGGMVDDKIICSHAPIPLWQRRFILLFFELYAKAKMLINFVRGQHGKNTCAGWCTAESAFARASPQD